MFVTENILQAPDNLFQLFSLNYDFANAWHTFTTAGSDAQRVLNIKVDGTCFLTGQRHLGMEDGLTATFACIDWGKKGLRWLQRI